MKWMRWITLLAVLMLLVSAGCGGTMPGGAKVLQSEKQRETAPAVNAEDFAALVTGNNAFALALYQQLAGGKGNLFFSPYSISQALAMTYAGARGSTADEMARTLRLSLAQDTLHPAFNALDLQLADRENDVYEKGDQGFQLDIANSLWGQNGYTFLEPFLDTLALNYGAGLRLTDFENDPESAREAINRWVEEQTADKIQNLIPQGLINRFTTLVLANAIYFKAAWQNPFGEENTQDAPFHLLDGGTIRVPTMRQTAFLGYAQTDDVEVVSLPYLGGKVMMTILMPREGRFESFRAGLDAAALRQILDARSYGEVDLMMPRFKMESDFSLGETLAAMGMPTAFTDGADFSGMDGTRDLHIGAVVHKAYVDVNEKGTEAAAATAVLMMRAMAPAGGPLEIKVDRPFIFLIHDEPSGAILFLGQVNQPQP